MAQILGQQAGQFAGEAGRYQQVEKVVFALEIVVPRLQRLQQRLLAQGGTARLGPVLPRREVRPQPEVAVSTLFLVERAGKPDGGDTRVDVAVGLPQQLQHFAQGRKLAAGLPATVVGVVLAVQVVEVSPARLQETLPPPI